MLNLKDIPFKGWSTYAGYHVDLGYNKIKTPIPKDTFRVGLPSLKNNPVDSTNRREFDDKS